MAQSTNNRPTGYRPALTRFAVILLTMGSGASWWLIVAFVLGVIALGVFSNFVFSAAFDPAGLTWETLLRVSVAVTICIVLAYLAYRFDLYLAWRSPKFDPVFGEKEWAVPHTGLILLISPGSIELPLFVIRYHYRSEGSETLRHCWLLITPDARPAFDQLLVRVEEVQFAVKLHPVFLDEATIEATYRAVDQIYTVEAARVGLQAQQIIGDLTGGLKPMTAGMVLACLPYRRRSMEYVASQRDTSGKPIEHTQKVIKVDVDFAPNRARRGV